MNDRKNSRINRRIARIFSIIAIVVSIYVALETPSETGYGFFFLIPLVFGFLLLCKPVLNFIDFSNIGPMVLTYTMLVKYIISPFISCAAGYESWLGLAPGSSNINKAVFLTLYEVIVLYIVCILCSRKYKRKADKSEVEVEPLNHKWVHYILIITGFACFFAIPSTFIDYRFIFNQSNLAENMKIEASGAGVFRTLFAIGRYSLVLLIIDYFYKRNQKKKSLFNLFGAFLPIMINCIHVSNLSRISILVPMVIGLSLSVQFFPSRREKKTLIVFCVSIGLAFLFVLSFLKFFGEGRGDISNAESLVWWADTINMYFTGIKETAVGCKAEVLINEVYGWNRIALFFNDIFSNISLLSNLSNPMKGTVRLFNTAYFGQSIISQIPPNINAGSYYFSEFFSALWPAFFVALSYKFSYRCKTKAHIDDKFVYAFAATWSGLVLMISTTMIIANTVNIALFYGVTLLFNKHIKFSDTKGGR